MTKQEQNTSGLFAPMEENTSEEKKEWRKKEFLNITTENDMKRRQYNFHDELRKEKR